VPVDAVAGRLDVTSADGNWVAVFPPCPSPRHAGHDLMFDECLVGQGYEAWGGVCALVLGEWRGSIGSRSPRCCATEDPLLMITAWVRGPGKQDP